MTPVACRIGSGIPRNWRDGTYGIKWLLGRHEDMSSDLQHPHLRKPGLLASQPILLGEFF